MAIVLPAIAVGLVWHRVVTEKVRRRLAQFESRFPTRTVVGVMDQAGFAAALASLGVRSRRRLIVGVLLVDRGGFSVWREFREPREVLRIPREQIAQIATERVTLGGSKSRTRCVFTIRTTADSTLDLPIYFQGDGWGWFNIPDDSVVRERVEAITRELAL